MIYAKPGHTFEAILTGAPSGSTTIGVRILDTPGDNEILARTTDGISEAPAGSGVYSVELTAPSEAGSYAVIWDTGGDSPTFTAEDLIVSGRIPSDYSAPSGTDLATVEDVLLYRQEIQESTQLDPDLIQTLISAVSEAISDYARREFTPTDGETRRFAYGGSGVLTLDHSDLRAIESIKLIRSGGETVLDPSSLGLRPLPTKTGTYEYLTGLPQGEGEVEIEGDWGMAEVPAKVRDAAIKQVNIWTHSYTAPSSSLLEDDLGGIGSRPVYLAGAIQAALAPYRRLTVG